MTYEVPRPRSLEEFSKFMERFGHLTRGKLREMQEMVDERVTFIKDLCRIRPYHGQ